MKYFIIDGRLGSEIKEKFVDFVNAYSDEHIHITINSTGGGSMHMNTIVGIINSQPQKFTVKLIAGYSAAFDLFRLVKCKREMIQRVIGMTHYSYDSFDMSVNGTFKYDDDEFKHQHYKKDWATQERKVAKQILTKEEYKRFKKGKDVYLDPDRMKQIFPEAIIVN